MIVAFAAISAGIAVVTLRGRKDVFPLALIAGSWIAISSAFLISQIKMHDLGTFFMIAMWLIATSTVASLLLMR